MQECQFIGVPLSAQVIPLNYLKIACATQDLSIYILYIVMTAHVFLN